VRDAYARFGKRGFDLAAAAALLVLLAPLFGALALAVWVALGRPVMFRQPRAGRFGRPFAVQKFRSLREGDGPDAERLTRFGRLLRASGADELPQLWNVLRGEMSLVGPRPLPVAYTALLDARQRARLRVRPGLAGLAQAAGRNAVPWPERLEWDARYAEAAPRFVADLRLLGRCARLVLRGEGVSAPGHATMPPLAAAEYDQELHRRG
jgi:lipopolysaccharide/colanic/teichoic acid biosynthesis glycosyltransferase